MISLFFCHTAKHSKRVVKLLSAPYAAALRTSQETNRNGYFTPFGFSSISFIPGNANRKDTIIIE